MPKMIAAAVLAGALFSGQAWAADASKPTVVLVHGAFADASSWNGVAKILIQDGYPVLAVANPLRGGNNDATYVADIVKSIKAPVVLVGHSYGGLVISAAGRGQGNVKALVFVAAFALESGETAGELVGKFGGTLGAVLAAPVPLSAGGEDLYISQGAFHQQFAHDVAANDAALMAATQRPIAKAALEEKFGEPAWRTVPSWSSMRANPAVSSPG